MIFSLKFPGGEKMIKKFEQFLSAIVISVSLSICISSCGSDKVPVSTASDKARDLFVEGRNLADRYDLERARNLLNQAVDLDSTFALAYYQLSLLQDSNKDFLRYLDLAKSYIGNTSSGERWLISALDARVNGFPEKEREYLEQLLEAYPEDERMYAIMGNYYQFILQDFEMAQKYYLKAIDINPEYPPPYNELGYNYRSLENYIKAEEAFKKYINLIPDSPNPYDSYAELLLKMGEYEASIELYEKALSIDPYFLNSHVGIATNLTLKRDYKEARKQLKEFYIKARDNDERRYALLAMAIALVDERKMEEALKLLDKRFDMAKSNKDTSAMAGDMNLMGFILQGIGQYDRAKAYYEKSSQLIQDSGLNIEIKDRLSRGYLFNMGRVALLQGKFEEAKVLSRKYEIEAKKANIPAQLSAVHTLNGLIAFHEKAYQTAIEEFQQANQRNAYNLFWLAASYEATNDTAKAMNFYQRAANINSIFDIAYALVRTKAELKVAALKAALP
jgi:tetratricopeptide (TPR) repeat protein